MKLNRINDGYRNLQAVSVLNTLDLDSDSNPIGMKEAQDDSTSANFGTERVPRRGGAYHMLAGYFIYPEYTLDLSTVDILEISFKYKIETDDLGTQRLFGFSSTYNGSDIYLGLGHSGGKFQISHTGHISGNANPVPTDKEFHDIGFKYIRSEDRVYFYLDDNIYSETGFTVTGIYDLFISQQFRTLKDSYIFNFNLYVNSNHIWHFKCSENSGDICYDSSGNDNHGGIVNAITAPPEENPNSIHQYQDVYSWQDEVGFSIDDSGAYDVIIPRDESVQLPPFRDVLGNNLQFIGKVGGRAKFVESSCFAGGGGAYVELSNTSGANEIDFSFKMTIDQHGIHTGKGRYVGVDLAWYIYSNSTTFNVLTRRNGATVVTSIIWATTERGEHPPMGSVFGVRCTITNTFNRLEIVGEAIAENTGLAAIDISAYDITVGALATGINANDGKLWDFKITDIEHWLLCEPIKDPPSHTYYDVSGNGNHATLINGTIANEGKQDQFHPLQNGLLDDGVNQVVPILSDGSAFADGSLLTDLNAILQDGKSFLNTGCKLQQYRYPALVQSEQLHRFWTNTNDDVVDIEFAAFTGVESDRIFEDVSESNRIKNIRTYKVALAGRQLNTEKRITNN